ncbi:galactose oxidase-like domain-containing protein [Amycolatopsis sp. NPDC059657]|uniref:galactose oxidase-like domain-containing protein n=1 Tax=Amycolatopsis sp. NPDC059657 TaxID=3346899 RepID=UPI00366DFA43
MTQHDFYLRIEPLPGYSPLSPLHCSRRYGRDCLRGHGHEIGRVTPREIFASTLDAMVYRRYHDPDHTEPVTEPLIAADMNEPPWDRRVPGCVLYADVGDEIAIHVRNGDPDECHSLHLHGLEYGIASDGAWPLGVQAKDGSRSDDIHPGGSWTYRFTATEETVGVWAFHDHHQMVQSWINRGLFGALIVRDPAAEPADHEIPLFLHQMSGDAAADGFESPALHGGASYPHTFGMTPRSFPYHCKIHGVTMSGTVTVQAGAPHATSVVIGDNFFSPAAATVAPGGTVTWFNSGHHDHVVFAGGGGGTSYCLNGRTYVGNTPTIVTEPGRRLRWYLLNLDVGDTWHNFHPHAARWNLPSGGAADVHPLSPVEGFTVDTVAPTPFPDLQSQQSGREVTVRGDFLVHCHLEEHMMSGLAGLVRSRQRLRVTDEPLDIELPYDDGKCCTDLDGTRSCKPMSHHEMPGMAHEEHDVLTHAAMAGFWEMLPCDSVTLAVHFALLHTGKVLIFSGSGNFPPRHDAHIYGSVLWDYEEGTFTQVPVSYDVFCAGQATLPNGDLLAAGGTKRYDDPWQGAPESALFNGEAWTNLPNMADGRWYPTLVSLGDGTVIAVSGTNEAGDATNDVPEIFDPATGTWTPTPFLRPSLPLYPHLFQLRDGKLFFTGAGLGFTELGGYKLDPADGAEIPVPGLRLATNRDQACSVLLPPAQDQKVLVMGGWGEAGATPFADLADLSASEPSYVPAASMKHGRTMANAVILPDRTVFVTGGGAGFEADPVFESEIYDPSTGKWSATAPATVGRLYHSVALLLPDCRVATAGSNPDRDDDELRIEIFHPPYLFRGARPFLEDAPVEITYGERYRLRTPQARDLRWAQLIRPMATTHSYESGQRLVDLPFTVTKRGDVRVTIPDEPNLAPPGWWMLFVVDMKRRPSDAWWVHLS